MTPDLELRADGPAVPLEDCPIGLFWTDGGELCLRTEYGNNEGRIDAYIVSSGEFFWGKSPQTIASQRAQMVQPVALSSRAEREPVGAGWHVSTKESDGRTWLTLSMPGGQSASLSCRTASDNGETISSQVVKAFARDYPAPPATEREPVEVKPTAWRWRWSHHKTARWVLSTRPQGDVREPLYPAPLPAEVRRVLEMPDRFVENQVDGYEFRFDNGAGYTPTEAEKAMLVDFGHSLIADIDAARALADKIGGAE